MTEATLTSKDEVRVFGNQHGTWVEVTGELRLAVIAACEHEGITPEEFLARALEAYVNVEEA